jgi:hypothetical protein
MTAITLRQRLRPIKDFVSEQYCLADPPTVVRDFIGQAL